MNLNLTQEELEEEEREFDRLWASLPKDRANNTELSPLFCSSQDELENISSTTKDALQALIYDDDPNETADNFKEQGNNLLKKAAANKTLYPQVLHYYSTGLEQQITNKFLLAQLLANRSHVHLLVGNNGHAIADAKHAITALTDLVNYNKNLSTEEKVGDDIAEDINKLTEQKLKAVEDLKVKAFYRVAKGALAIQKYKLTIQYCEKALQSKAITEQTKKDILKIKQSAISKLEELFREREEKRSRIRAEKEIPVRIKNLLEERGIQIGDSELNSAHFNQLIANQTKETSGHQSGIQILDQDGSPVFFFRAILVYDEFAQTDIIQSFSEEDTFEDHMGYMFPPEGDPFPYGQDDPTAIRRYVNGNLAISFYDQSSKKTANDVYLKFSPKKTLREILTHPKYKLPGGFMPVFHVAPLNSEFSSKWKPLK
jgi:hypothetical protein